MVDINLLGHPLNQLVINMATILMTVVAINPLIGIGAQDDLTTIIRNITHLEPHFPPKPHVSGVLGSYSPSKSPCKDAIGLRLFLV